MNKYSYRNQMFLVGRHQEVCRFVHRIWPTSHRQSVVIAGCHAVELTMEDIRQFSLAVVRFISSESGDLAADD